MMFLRIDFSKTIVGHTTLVLHICINVPNHIMSIYTSIHIEASKTKIMQIINFYLKL
jgi:hypothetical protein